MPQRLMNKIAKYPSVVKISSLKIHFSYFPRACFVHSKKKSKRKKKSDVIELLLVKFKLFDLTNTKVITYKKKLLYI